MGCNKAIDAVNALRMGSRNPTKFNVTQWKQTLAQSHEQDFAQSSCAQFERDGTTTTTTMTTTTTPLVATTTTSSLLPPHHHHHRHRHAQVYCFEPVTATFAELHRTKLELGWTNELVLEEAAVSSQAGSLWVPRQVALGTENRGLDTIQCDTMTHAVDNNQCRQIPIYTLNDYVEALPRRPPIHFLSIDVEGFDFEVLKGASRILANHVHYLEFEYNWKGPWGKQQLKDAIDYLSHDDQGFQCYWPGRTGHIWRITGCWLDHYAYRFWSNVACVNGNLADARPLAEDMERAFLATLEVEGLVYDKKRTM